MSQAIQPAAAAPAAPANARDQSQLNHLMRQYRSDLSNHAEATVLTSLAHQITATAKSLGTTVTLPKPAGSAAPPPAVPPVGGSDGNVNMTA